MYRIESGSKPISLAATASMATWSALASSTFLTWGIMQRGPGAVAREGAVHHREDSTVDLLLDHQQVHQRVVNHRMRPVAPLVQQTAEGVLHRARWWW